MSSEKPKTIHRADYRAPDYQIERVELHFDLRDADTTVRARLQMFREPALQGDAPPLVLDGEGLELEGVWLDGRELAAAEYHATDEDLTIHSVPDRFELETQVRIRPRDNTALSGLYQSNGIFCTQCEAMGFRRITYFLDRPDVMARYRTVIEGDENACPVMLSNGNRVEAESLKDGRHRVAWEDPHPKPSYLFALVAGDLRCHAGEFRTASGREVRLEIWVEPQNIDRCEHALTSLQKAMRWDEETYGLEYDLDIYMIVAVNDFNMGAMENKGLNVFNSKFVLALPETATDEDYEGIEGVIAHEYFHNWTGNRVTCRDWFQLTLKEGLTVFRDQQFTADMTSKAVKRIQDVNLLRTAQFAEDAGPMAHPIRPEAYISMDNFYTVTVYEKGAEVIRLYQTLLGAGGFRRGMDLYFRRHDGHAVTCDDFRAAMADANEFSLDRFERWYSQAGTPELKVEGEFDPESRRYTLTLEQSVSAGGEEEDGRGSRQAVAEPLHMPVAVGLLGGDGGDLPLRLAGEEEATGTTRVLELMERKETFVFEDIPTAPVPSVLRGFSAPVRVVFERSREELAFLMANDGDAFNRWDAGQELAKQVLLDLSGQVTAGESAASLELDPLFSEAFGRLLGDASLDGSLRALALTLPSERLLGQEQSVIEVDGLYAARQFAREELARRHRQSLLSTYESQATDRPYASDRASVDRRRLRNCALGLLAAVDGPEIRSLLLAQFRESDNMTDRQAALSALVDLDCPEREVALREFHESWSHDPLVLDKWFGVQARCSLPDTVSRVRELVGHPDFTTGNPNRVRSLIGVFCAANQTRFHTPGGEGYELLTDSVLEIDSTNPQLAARLVSSFNAWKRFDAGRQSDMGKQLERIRAKPTLSKDVYEIVERALA